MEKYEQGAKIRVVHMRDDAFEIRVRDHFIQVDQPQGNGMDEMGPTPTELFAASIAACAAYYARRFLARHGLDDHVVVGADWGSGGVPWRVTDMTVRIAAPDLPAELTDRFLATVGRCTLKNTLEDPPSIHLELDGETSSNSFTSGHGDMARAAS